MMSPYLDPPTIPEGMTVAEYRAARLPRHLSVWKHAAWFLLHATSNKGKDPHPMRAWLARRRERRAAYQDVMAIINRPMRRHYIDGREYVRPLEVDKPPHTRHTGI